MTFRGHIKDGTVVFDEPPALPDGTVVDVLPRKAVRKAKTATRKVKKALPGGKKKPSGLHDWMLKYAGVIEGPADLSAQHNHYLHGIPKGDR